MSRERLVSTITLVFLLLAPANAGEVVWEVRAGDPLQPAASVLAANIPPVANAGSIQNVSEGEIVYLNGSNSYDPDGAIVSYSWTQVEGTAVVLLDASSQTASFEAPIYPSGDPLDATGEALKFKLEVTDDQGDSASNCVWINVSDGCLPPGADAGDDQAVIEGSQVCMDCTVNCCGFDLDGIIVSRKWRQVSGPPVEFFPGPSPKTPCFIVPPADQTGPTLVFELEVTDDCGLKDTDNVIVYVENVNQPPVLDPINSKGIGEGELLEFSILATDPDGGGLTYSASNLPLGAVFDPTTQTFSWTPNYDQAGTYAGVVFTVTDDGYPPLSDSEAITITVSGKIGPPILDPIGDKVVKEGELLQFTVTATDPEGDDLTYSASNLPPGANFDLTTRTFSWVPDFDEDDEYKVTFTVMDSGSPPMTDSEEITITVIDMARPPVLSPIGDKAVPAGELLEFIVIAFHPDLNDFIYTVSGLPGGATFDPTTQTFSWTPNYDQTGTYEDIVFTVISDGDPQLSDSESITITVYGDDDNDGISDKEEDGGPNGGDGNSDGTPDCKQENVTSFQTHDSQYYVTLESLAGTTISDVEAVISPADSPPGVAFPYGFFNFTINGVGVGGTTVMVYLPDGATPTTFFKYGPEPNDPNDHWYEFLYDGETGAEIQGNIITLHLVDGRRGDDDLDDTNGVIVDLGGPAVSNSDSGGGSDEGGGGGGCFVSAAAFSPL